MFTSSSEAKGQESKGSTEVRLWDKLQDSFSENFCLLLVDSSLQ